MTGQGNKLACPRCGSGDYLGENVEGWRGVDDVRMVDGRVRVTRQTTSVEDAERVSFFCSNRGCDEDCEIHERDLVQLGSDGQPLPAIPGQEKLL
jgi:hypothetical protein